MCKGFKANQLFFLHILACKRGVCLVFSVGYVFFSKPYVCRIIKADPTLRATKVIIVTGDDSAATRELYKGLGCGAVLNKPFTKSDINSTVGKVLGVGTRQIHRVNTVIPCLVRIGPGGYDCRILNISASGMYIEIDFLPEPGRNFEVEFIVDYIENISPDS